MFSSSISNFFSSAFKGPNIVELENTLAHVIAISSRGPNIATPDILKSNVIASEIDILASWSPIVPPYEVDDDARKLEFNIMSGTFMAMSTCI
ncbi:Subtilase family protein [Trifolium repens]|nr:Subtilase family protein [Trifolium repens]